MLSIKKLLKTSLPITLALLFIALIPVNVLAIERKHPVTNGTMLVPSGVVPEVSGQNNERLKLSGNGIKIRVINRATLVLEINNGDQKAVQSQASTNTEQRTLNELLGTLLIRKHSKDNKHNSQAKGSLAYFKMKGISDANLADFNDLKKRWKPYKITSSDIFESIEKYTEGMLQLRINDGGGGGIGSAILPQPDHKTFEPCLDGWGVVNSIGYAGRARTAQGEVFNQDVAWACDSQGDEIYLTKDDFKDIEKINITHTPNEDATELQVVFPDDDEQDNFQFCGGDKYALGTKEKACQGSRENWVISGLTPEMILNDNNVSRKVTMSNGSENSEITVATGKTAREDAAVLNEAELATQGKAIEDPEDSCEASNVFMSYFVCGFLRILDGVANDLDGVVAGLLKVDLRRLDSGGPKAAWSRVRNISYAILVIIMLVMVISTALNFQFLDPYTVKRSLPRLFAAIIFIALSWEITHFILLLANDFGDGIAGLVGRAVKEGGIDSIHLINIMNPGEGAAAGAGAAVGGTLTLAAGAIAVAAGAGGALLGYLLLLLLAGVLALFLGIMLLAFREVLLYGLVIISPLPILSWIFPNNDKLWKLWWQSFSKLAVLYPIIVLMITMGKTFAWIIATAEQNPDTGVEAGAFAFFGNLTLKFIAYFAPYFLIPLTFKMAGGAFANIAGVFNDKKRGVFDRMRNLRAKTAKSGWEQTSRGAKTGKAGKRAQKLFHLNKVGLRDLRNRDTRRAGFDRAIRQSNMLYGKEASEDTELSQFMMDDGVSAMLSSVLMGDEVGLEETLGVQLKGDKTKIKEALSAVKKQTNVRAKMGTLLEKTEYSPNDRGVILSQINNARAKYGDTVLAREAAVFAAKGGTAYGDADHMARVIGVAAGGDDNSLSDLTVRAREASASAGRGKDLVGSFGLIKSSAEAAAQATSIEQLEGMGITKAVERQIRMSSGPGTLTAETLKPQSSKNVARGFVVDFKEAISSGLESEKDGVLGIEDAVQLLNQLEGDREYAEVYSKPDVVKSIDKIYETEIEVNGEKIKFKDAANRFKLEHKDKFDASRRAKRRINPDHIYQQNQQDQ